MVLQYNTYMKRFALKIIIGTFALCLAICAVFYFASIPLSKKLIDEYKQRESITFLDRDGNVILVQPNTKEYYAVYVDDIPKDFKESLIEKEDRFFYQHLGANYISTLRALKNTILDSGSTASSTITQQLVKVLLSNESDRTIKNKLIETFYSVALELHTSKDEVLTMYYNSIFLGNNTQGI